MRIKFIHIFIKLQAIANPGTSSGLSFSETLYFSTSFKFMYTIHMESMCKDQKGNQSEYHPHAGENQLFPE